LTRLLQMTDNNLHADIRPSINEYHPFPRLGIKAAGTFGLYFGLESER